MTGPNIFRVHKVLLIGTYFDLVVSHILIWLSRIGKHAKPLFHIPHIGLTSIPRMRADTLTRITTAHRTKQHLAPDGNVRPLNFHCPYPMQIHWLLMLNAHSSPVFVCPRVSQGNADAERMVKFLATLVTRQNEEATEDEEAEEFLEQMLTFLVYVHLNYLSV